MDTLRGVFPVQKPPPKRDFLRENVIKLRNLQKAIKSEEDLLKTKPTTNLKRQSKFQSQQNLQNFKVDLNKNRPTAISRRSSSMSRETLRSTSSQKSFTIDRSSQTIDVDTEYFLKDAIIRYPSESVIENLRPSDETELKKQTFVENGNNDNEDNFNGKDFDNDANNHSKPVENPNEYFDSGSVKSQKSTRPTADEMKNHIDEIESAMNNVMRNKPSLAVNSNSGGRKSNWDAVSSCPSKASVATTIKSNKSELPAGYRKGAVPKYLQERKEEEMKVREQQAREYDPDCPHGHVALTEGERIENLEIAQNKYRDLINEINRMPMTHESMKLRRRKIEVEKELESLEGTIRIFSRSKVYVKIDE